MKRYIHLLVVLFCVCSQMVLAQKPYPIDTIDGQAVYRYPVEKSIGLYRIGVNFWVSQEDIIRFNPELKERGLRYGETIYVPVVLVEPTVQQEDTATATPTTPITLVDTQVADTVIMVAAEDTIIPVDTVITQDGVFHLALLLPLQAEAQKRDPIFERFTEFYEGVLVAIYTLQDSSRFALHVYDIGRSDAQILQLINQGDLQHMDAIIGTAYPGQVTAISKLALQDSVPTLIPFSDRVPQIETNPFLFQFNPTVQLEAQAMVEYMETIRDSINCVFIDAKEVDIPYAIRELQQQIRNHNISRTHISVHDILSDSLSKALQDSVENILILNTGKFSNAQALLPHIINGKGAHDLALFSQYSWQGDKILLPQVYTSIFAAEQDSLRNEYEELYGRYFHHEHVSTLPRYDMLGYDLTRQFVAWIRGEEYHGVQSEVLFQKTNPNGGYINQNVQVIRK